jgi:hypothetical protein
MHYKEGFHRKRLSYPSQRIATWQFMNTEQDGTYLATAKGIVWLNNSGSVSETLKDDGSGIQHWEISPDGRAIVWATRYDRIFVSRDGGPALFLDFGRDPCWHPRDRIIAYAGARRLGMKSISYDLKVMDQSGKQRWLTSTQFSRERWPRFIGKGPFQLTFTRENTTDIYLHGRNLF